MGEDIGGQDRRPRAVVRWPEDDGGARLPHGVRLPVLGLALDVAVAGAVLAVALLVSSFLAWLTALPLVVWAMPRLVWRLVQRRLRARGLGRLTDVRPTEVTAVAAGVFAIAVVGVGSGPPADLVSRVTEHDPTAEVVGTFLVAVVLAPACWAVAFAWGARRALRRRLDELLVWQDVLDGVAPIAPVAPPDATSDRDARPVWRAGSEVGASLTSLAPRAGPTAETVEAARRSPTAASVALGAVGFALAAVVAWVAGVTALIMAVFWIAGG